MMDSFPSPSPTTVAGQARLAALHHYQILDTLPETVFDRLTRLAAQFCDTPVAFINLIDHDRQWTKAAAVGPPDAIPRAFSCCAHTIQQHTVHLVPDTVADPLFVDNPFVQGPPGIHFYAGAPIRTVDGHNIGTLCVFDMQPRTLSESQPSALADPVVVVLDTLLMRVRCFWLGTSRAINNAFSHDFANRFSPHRTCGRSTLLPRPFFRCCPCTQGLDRDLTRHNIYLPSPR